MKSKPVYCYKCGGKMVNKTISMKFNIPGKPEKEDTSPKGDNVTLGTSSESLKRIVREMIDHKIERCKRSFGSSTDKECRHCVNNKEKMTQGKENLAPLGELEASINKQVNCDCPC